MNPIYKILAISLIALSAFSADGPIDNFEINLHRHKSFNNDDAKYLISIYHRNANVYENVTIYNNGNIQYHREVVNHAHQANGQGKNGEFIETIDSLIPNPLDTDINTFIPQTLITHKMNGKWTTHWYSSNEILISYFRKTVNK